MIYCRCYHSQRSQIAVVWGAHCAAGTCTGTGGISVDVSVLFFFTSSFCHCYCFYGSCLLVLIIFCKYIIFWKNFVMKLFLWMHSSKKDWKQRQFYLFLYEITPIHWPSPQFHVMSIAIKFSIEMRDIIILHCYLFHSVYNLVKTKVFLSLIP